MFEKAPVSWSGENVWRQSIAARVTMLVLAAGFVAATCWVATDGPLSVKDALLYGGGSLYALIVVPVAAFRWRMVIEHDELVIVFFRERRVRLREIVEVKNVAKRGLVLVLADGTEETTMLFGNGAWGHRRAKPTRSDLAARAVICAAARARGEAEPVDFRLGKVGGLKQAAVEGGIMAVILGLIFGG